jgi:hypothetical protein
MHALLPSKSLHAALPIEQYGPGSSSGLGIVTSSGLACIDMLPAGILLPLMLPLDAILLIKSMAFCILGRVHALSAWTEHLLHWHFISTSVFNSTLGFSFFLKILKKSPHRKVNSPV